MIIFAKRLLEIYRLAAKHDPRKALTAIHIIARGKYVRLEATDGKVACVVKAEAENGDNETIDCLISRKMARRVLSVCNNLLSAIGIAVDGDVIRAYALTGESAHWEVTAQFEEAPIRGWSCDFDGKIIEWDAKPGADPAHYAPRLLRKLARTAVKMGFGERGYQPDGLTLYASAVNPNLFNAVRPENNVRALFLIMPMKARDESLLALPTREEMSV